MRIHVWSGETSDLYVWSQNRHAFSTVKEEKPWPTRAMVFVHEKDLDEVVKKHGKDGVLPPQIRESIVLGIDPAKPFFNGANTEGLTLVPIGQWDLLPSAMCPEQLQDWYSKLVMENIRIFQLSLMKDGRWRKCSIDDFPLAKEHITICSPCARKAKYAIDLINDQIKALDNSSPNKRNLVLTMELRESDSGYCWDTTFAGVKLPD